VSTNTLGDVPWDRNHKDHCCVLLLAQKIKKAALAFLCCENEQHFKSNTSVIGLIWYGCNDLLVSMA